MDEIIKLLINMGKTKEEIAEFVGKEIPKGGVSNVSSNILKPLTKKAVGDFPLIGSKITDPTSVKNFDFKSISESIADQEKAWKKTFEFLREGGYNLSALQKQNLNYNLGILKNSKNTAKNLQKTTNKQPSNVYDLEKNLLDPNEPIVGGTQPIKTYKENKMKDINEKETKLSKEVEEDLIIRGKELDLDSDMMKTQYAKFIKDEGKIGTLKDFHADFEKATGLTVPIDNLRQAWRMKRSYPFNTPVVDKTGKYIGVEATQKMYPKSKKFKVEESAESFMNPKVKKEKAVPVKPRQGKFTKAEYLIQRLENTLKDPNADPYVRKTFPGFIDELKANPDLAKNENVFKELGGDLPDNQKIKVYDDDTLDFFTKKPEKSFKLNVETFKRDFNVTDKEIEEILKLSPKEQQEILKKYIDEDLEQQITLMDFDPKDTKPNAEGGLIKLAEGGIIGLRR